MEDASSHQSLWSIVLAAGEGERLKPFVRELLGYEKPKQYCTFIGTRSMPTLDRLIRSSARENKVTVVPGAITFRMD